MPARAGARLILPGPDRSAFSLHGDVEYMFKERRRALGRHLGKPFHHRRMSFYGSSHQTPLRSEPDPRTAARNHARPGPSRLVRGNSGASRLRAKRGEVTNCGRFSEVSCRARSLNCPAAVADFHYAACTTTGFPYPNIVGRANLPFRNMRDSKSDRRAKPRVHASVPVTLKLDNGSGQHRGMTRDLSHNGVFFYADSQISEGSTLEMVLILPSELTAGERKWVCCQASVVRVEQGAENGFGIAASIQRLDILPEIPD